MVSAVVAEEPVKVSPAEKAVRNLEREWLDAYEKHDAEAMDRIVAEDFAITFPNGEIQEKPALMAMIRSPRTGPEMHFHTEEVRSRPYGDTVILMGVVVAEYEKEGKPVSEKSRYTDTYVKRNGKWQVAASHLSVAGK
jgi:uncharacterized protein (TIGR02246 family)